MHHLHMVDPMEVNDKAFDSEFEKDVFHGLTHNPKWLSSKYFYDRKGDQIFQQIMKMDSYYLTRAELEIFTTEKEEILKIIDQEGSKFRLVELGAGDGLKTKELLKYFHSTSADFSYCPVDISGNVLDVLEKDMLKDIPGLNISCMQGDYFHMLSDLAMAGDEKTVVMFLGSNIGNFSRTAAADFLKNIRKSIKKDDLLMIGFDLKKEPSKILSAYDDEEGITASFNMNLLQRINDELGGDFEITNFKHAPCYNPETGECRSYILSTKDQEVYIEKLERAFTFEKWEAVFMEVSKKYSLSEMNNLVESCGFEFVKSFSDHNEYYTDGFWKAI